MRGQLPEKRVEDREDVRAGLNKTELRGTWRLGSLRNTLLFLCLSVPVCKMKGFICSQDTNTMAYLNLCWDRFTVPWGCFRGHLHSPLASLSALYSTLES